MRTRQGQPAGSRARARSNSDSPLMASRRPDQRMRSPSASVAGTALPDLDDAVARHQQQSSSVGRNPAELLGVAHQDHLHLLGRPGDARPNLTAAD